VIQIGFFLSLAISLVLTRALRDFALRRRLIDAADSSRKLHTRDTPRLGGVAIIGAFLVAFGAAASFDEFLRSAFLHDPRVTTLVGGALAFALLGLADDLRNLPARWKLLGQVVVTVGLFAAGMRATAVACPGLGKLDLGAFSLPVTVIWIVGVVNAVNLIDGLDGLAGGISALALGTLAAIAAFRGDAVTAAILVVAVAAVLGFLRYNFHPASIFMGDAGSMSLGYLIAASALLVCRQPSSAIALDVVFAVLAVPIVDTSLSVARRILRGRSIFSADREHIHHALVDAGISHRGTVLILCAFSALLCAVAVTAALAGGPLAAFIEVGICACAALALRKVRFLGLGIGRLGEERRRLRMLRDAVRLVAGRLRNATTLPEVLEMLAPIPEVVSASRAVAVVAAAGLRRDFQPERSTDRGPIFSAHFAIGKPSFGDVEVHWSDGRNRIDRDEEIALERICVFVEKALRRIDPDKAGAANAPQARPDRNLAAPAQTG
jgi:UDP-GlcNAc:undecaprenyl-phosphate GlcNAc-1-phosphate transferase